MSIPVPLEGFGGGGAALNFKVLAYATEGELLAAAPAENTIGVITTKPITSYIFSAEEPSPAEGGMVWFTVGTSSTVAFSATKKNPVMVYPLAAKQYVSGAWVDVTCKSYQGGAWVDWIRYNILYDSGDENEIVTGGWVNRMVGISTSRTKALTITKGTSSLAASAATGGGSMITTENKIDLTEYSEIVFDGTITSMNAPWCFMGVWSEIGTTSGANLSAQLRFDSGTHTGEQRLDVAALSGSYYVGFMLDSASIDMSLTELK